MNFEEFKDQFIEDVKQGLYERGIDANISAHTVSKLNESYEAVTVNPEGSNIGVNMNIDKFFYRIFDFIQRHKVVRSSANRNWMFEGIGGNHQQVDRRELSGHRHCLSICFL